MKRTFTTLSAFSTRMLVLTGVFVIAYNFNSLQAQISGVKNIPGDYATITLAVADVNALGVGAGGVTFNVAAGYTETIAATISLTATGTLANPITFQKSGGGANPLITSYTGGTGTPGTAVQDGIWRLVGSDFVTINGIDLVENAANTANPATMEYGYALYKASATDGCQNVTIQNCVITLNRVNNASGSGPAVDGSRGIDVVNAISTAATTAVTVTAASGANSNNKFYSNTIQNCNIGIALIGFAATTPFSLADTGNDVGGSSLATGNTIRNYGGAAAATNPSAGVRTLAQYGINISYNTVNNNDGAGSNHVSTLRGIYLNTATSANATVNFNTLTIKSGATTSQVSVIENVSGSTAAGNTITIKNNTITGEYLTATSGIFYGIFNSGSPATISIENNTISNINYSVAALAGSGTIYLIYNTGAATTVNVRNNAVNNFSRTGTSGGTTIGIYVSSGTTQNVKLNTVHTLSIDGAGTASTLYGIQVSGTTVVVDSNAVYNLKCLKVTGSSALYGIYDISSPTNENYNYNDIYDLIHSGTGITYGMYHFTTTGTRTVSFNKIYNISSGGTTVSAINQASSSPKIFKNKIYNIQSTSNLAPTVSGLSLSSLGTSGVADIYNNLIGDIKAPFAATNTVGSPAVRGVNFTATTATSTLNVSYNTISLDASSTGANFGSACLFHTTSTTATSATLNLRNNILENLSTPKGTGLTVAYQRSSATLTNYGASSDRNLFFAGGPCASRLIYYDGTNSLQTLAAYKALAGLAPRDANSVTEDPSLLSTVGASSNFLHVNTAIATQIEGSGVTIAGITDDFDGNARNGATPDLGADEIAGTAAVACAGTPTAGTAAAANSPICSGQSTNICLTGQTAATGISVKWQSSATPGGPYLDIACAGATCYNTGPLTPGTYYYMAVVTCDNSGSTATSNEVAVVVNASPVVTVTPSAPTLCNGKSVSLNATGGNTYAWSPATGLNMITGPTVIASPNVTTIYTVTATDAIGCTGTVTVTVTVVPSPSVSATATPASICYGGNSQLQANNLSASTANTYTFSTGTGAALDPMTGATQVIGVSIDDTPTAAPAAIGFTFKYEGVNYTQYSVSPDGWLLLGGATAVSDFSNQVTDLTNIPKIYPYWDDLATGTDGNVKVLVTGTAPNQIFIVQWFVTIPRNTTGPATSTYQAWLYEGSGKIEFRYGAMGPQASGSASGGITGTTATNFNSLTFSTNTSSSATANDANADVPANGRIYTYVPPSLTYSWSPTTFLDNPAIANPLASGVTATTIYTVTATSGNGCTATASTTVTANPTITITETDNSGIANNDRIICAGASATLTASGGTSYAWSSGDNTAATTVTPAMTTTYTVTVTDAAMCTATGTITITVNPLPTPGITVAETSGLVNNDGIICTGASTTLTASGGNTYVWSTGSTMVAITVSPASTTTYTVTVTNANGCSATKSQTITVNPLPTPSISPSPASVCSGQSVDLTASGGTSYTWSTGATTATATVSPIANATYTVTVTDGNGCIASTTVSVTVDPAPTYTVQLFQPSSCFNPNGAIVLTMTGGVSPYTFNWATPNGCNLDQDGQNQDTLCVGTYLVTITGNNGCSTTASFNLTGPGGCFSCPTFGSFTSTPSAAQCADDEFTLVQDGLLDMGQNYGIIFKYSAVALADPYTGGTVLATVDNVDLTNNGGTATAIVSIPTGGTYFIYSILTPTPTDGACRPSSSLSKVINPIPDAVATPASQTTCSGNAITTIAIAGNVPNATYSWTRDNTISVTGIAANGTGDISGSLTNTTNAPITVTFTITPSANNCTGAQITATVLVNPTPNAVATPASQTICSASAITTIVLSGNVANATYNWTRDNVATVTGIAAGGSGNIAGALTNTTNAPVTVTFTITPTANNCPGAAITATVVVNPTPNAVATPASQTICSPSAITTIVLSGNVANTTYNWTRDNVATVTGIAAAGAGDIVGTLTNTTNAPITVTFTITPTANNCPGASITATILVNPRPNVVATPATQTICSGNLAAAIVLSGNVNASVFNWTRDNVLTVTGIAAAGAGNIPASTLTNTTNAPITVTFTITPTANACPGTAILATILVNPTPAAFVLTGGGSVCNTDNIGVPVGLSSSQTNVNYQLFRNGLPVGAPVAGTGAAISFGLQLAGTYTVVATHTQGACTRTMTGTITVTAFNCTVAISDPCICLNNATTLTNGQFGEVIKVNAPGTQIWTVTAINGLFRDPNIAPPSAPLPIVLGTALTNLGAAMNMFELKGRHVDAIGYTLTVSNGAGTFLTIGNSCQYPNPSITSDLSGDYCLFSNPVNLTGVPGDANIVSQSFTVNGVPATQFNPGQGPGQYLIVYTVNGGVPKAFGPNDPGCTQSVSTFVNVIATPTNVVCNDLVYISLDADCTADVSADAVLEGNYGCYDDYMVELDKSIPYGNGPWVPGTVNTADIGKTFQARVTHLVSGNKCWGNVKVEDKLGPTLICEDFTIPCNTPNLTPNYLKNILGFVVAIPSIADCQSTTQSYTDTEVDQNCASGLTKIILRKWTVVDASGNSSTCIQTIGLQRPGVDDLKLPPSYDGFDAPYFNCTASYPTPDWIESQGLQGYPWVFGRPSGCNINWTFEDTRIDVCDGTYKIVRDWTLLDWCAGQVIHHAQVIKISDDDAPSMSCPGNLTVSVDPFNCCATVNLPDVVIEDNCSRINNIGGMIVLREQYTGEVINMVTLGGSLVDFPGNNWWDRDTLAAFGWTSCLPMGAHTVTYLAEDDCGNVATCNFGLTVLDFTPPVAACDETTTVAIGGDDLADCYTSADGCEFAGVTWVKASIFSDGSYDNCNTVKFTIRRMEPYSDCINQLNDDPCYENEDGDLVFGEQDIAKMELDSIKFYCCEVGTTQTVILRVYQTDVNGLIMSAPDGNPLYNECMIQVEVQDKLKPACVPPAQVNVNCENFDPSLWAYGKPQVADNCCLDTTKVYQDQCGLTHSVSYTLFDTVCNKGTITRTFRAFDCHGLSSQCTQRVIVTYEQDYFVKFPNDAIVTVCDGTGVYGEPTFFGEDCELLGVSFEDEVFTVVTDACFKIERTWTIINWCTFNPNQPCINVPNPNPNPITNAAANLAGPTVSAAGTLAPWAPTLVRINPTDPQPTNYSTFWDKNANCYKYKQIIKIIDGQAPTGTYVVPDCSNAHWFTPNNGQLWNEMYWWDNGIGLHDLCEEPTDLCITATDACSGSNVNIEYLLFLDLDGNGSMETVINSVNTGIAGLGWNNVLYDNLNTPNFAGGIPRQFDERAVPNNQKYGFSIQETVSGNNKTACVRWNTQQSQNSYVTPELPHGTHKIKWFITDGCGNNKEYEYTFTVKDCKAPTVVCLNGLSVNIMPTGMITLWASDFLQYTEDNCTPSNQLKIGIRKCGTGTGFPLDANNNPITNVNFTCAETGTQCVELWSIDAAGNADYCETYVIVQDNLGNCAPSGQLIVSGALKTEMEDGIEEAVVNLIGSVNLTDAQGVYSFNNVPVGSSFAIAPEKDDNPLNGVTTYDLVLISKHILGIQPLNTPYKMIAADANKSGSITTFDIVEIRKLILGIYTELPSNTSWRFVDKAFDFPSPVNPFQTVFPEVININNAQVNQVDQDFVGVKIGDVNNTAVANVLLQSEERTAGTAIFDLEDRTVKAGEEFEVTFKSAQALKGFQFTATMNGLKVIGTVDAENVTSSNFNLTPENVLAVSIDGAQSFTVRFRALKAGRLSEMLGVSGTVTRAEAYGDAGRLNVAFRFDGKTIAGVGFELYQNQPNPFVNRTFVGFFLPEAAEATLSVFDETGRVVYQQKGQFAKGENTIALDRALINTTGLLYYRLETATDSATKKMIQAR
jgi:hypothetical protein